jgi:hypothetical protein
MATPKQTKPAPAETAVEEVSPDFYLKNDTGILQELELVKNTDTVVIFVIKEPKDLVTILIKGKPVEVDLVQLRKPTAGPMHGLSIERLILLAEAAKA